MENPGALGGATGAYDGSDGWKHISKIVFDAILPPLRELHLRALRMVASCLTLNDEAPAVWHDCAVVLRARLTPVEIGSIAFAALRALDPEPRQQVFEAAHWGEVTGAGAPMPPWLNIMDDARWWASLASRRERKAYCLAAFDAMPPADQSAFLRHVQREGAR